MNAAAQKGKMTYCTPRSPVLKTSMRFRPKQANISFTQLVDLILGWKIGGHIPTLHRPKPLTATSFSMRSSSLASTSILALSSPEANFSARPEMYSAFRCDRPAVRSVGRSFCRTCDGDGKEGCVSGNSAVNFLRMLAAA